MSEKNKKNKKPAANGKKSTSEALKDMREKQASGKDPKAAKKEKAAKKDNLVVMKGFDMLPPLKPEERKDKAQEIDAEVRSFDKEVNARGLKMGIMLREMKGYELWKELESKKTGKVFTSFDAWLKDAAPISRSGGYAQLKVADKLLPLIPKEELSQYPDYARKLIAKVPKIHLEKVDSPIRKAARTAKSPEELTSAINKHAPEAHVEQKTTIKVDASTAGVVRDAIQACMDFQSMNGEETNVSDAIEEIMADWFEIKTNYEQFAGMTNRQAWDALKKQRQFTEGEQAQAG